MSEYQYYGFLAIDRPLSTSDMAALRRISSRAQITPTSFTHEYNWGDLKADTSDLLRQYFDIHVYLSNWGSADFIARIPKSALDRDVLKRCFSDDHLQYTSCSNTWLIHWSPMINDSDGSDFDYEFIQRDWMPNLAPIREEILSGNLRALYLGWLKSIQSDDTDTADEEPFPWPKLGPLTAAQESLVEFLHIDPDLLTALDLSHQKDSPAQTKAIDTWLATLSPQQATSFLQQVLINPGSTGARKIKKEFSQWHSAQTSNNQPKTVSELLHLAEQARQHKEKLQAQARKREEAKRRKIRAAWLTELAKDFGTAWKSVHSQASSSKASEYDKACQQLLDLRDSYKAHDSLEEFYRKFDRFLETYKRRRALMARLEKAGLRIHATT